MHANVMDFMFRGHFTRSRGFFTDQDSAVNLEELHMLLRISAGESGTSVGTIEVCQSRAHACTCDGSYDSLIFHKNTWISSQAIGSEQAQTDFSKFFGPSPRKHRLPVYRGFQVKARRVIMRPGQKGRPSEQNYLWHGGASIVTCSRSICQIFIRFSGNTLDIPRKVVLETRDIPRHGSGA